MEQVLLAATELNEAQCILNEGVFESEFMTKPHLSGNSGDYLVENYLQYITFRHA